MTWRESFTSWWRPAPQPRQALVPRPRPSGLLEAVPTPVSVPGHPAGPELPAASGLPDPLVLQRSLSDIPGGAQRCAGDFYGYLFAANPELREMFPPQMAMQNERLFAALARIAETIERPDHLARYLAQLGAEHVKFGVRPEHYTLVGQALIKALRRSNFNWTEETEAAWITAYNFAAGAMMAGAETYRGPATWRGQIVRHERRSQNLAVLEVRTDQPLPYLAGQYVTVQTAKWPRVWRPFSIANAPTADGNWITLHVRSVPGGWVSTALVRDTAVGDEVIIGPAHGTMTSDQVAGRDLLMVAGGTGLAPIRALAERILIEDEAAVRSQTPGRTRRNIHLFHGAREPLGLYDLPGLRELSDLYPWLRVIPVVSDDPAFNGPKGTVPDVALGYADWLDRDVFLAGPDPMVAYTASKLAARGVPHDQVHYDDLEVSAAR
jgi:NAD(P)H-flavin reductase/hemoglobin-like flavoprotein